MRSAEEWIKEFSRSGYEKASTLDLILMIQADAQPTAGWMPIETAPRDGTWIMAYWPTMSITDFPAIVFADDCSLHDIWYLARDLDYGSVYPTHWMPLPLLLSDGNATP